MTAHHLEERIKALEEQQFKILEEFLKINGRISSITSALTEDARERIRKTDELNGVFR